MKPDTKTPKPERVARAVAIIVLITAVALCAAAWFRAIHWL